jgi:glycosyltransferase involved in cell wall biosynthesis
MNVTANDAPPAAARSGTPPRPRVSIITPAYNHAAFVAAAIESVLAQDLAAWEMVVIDDASGDGTAEIVQGYARRDGRIRLIRHESNWGVKNLAATYNQGLAAGSGEWIAILEGDDAWPPWKLERQLAGFKGDAGIVLGFGRALLISASDAWLGEVGDGLPRSVRRYFADFRGPALAPLLLRPCFIHPVTVMIRRAALEAIGGFRQPPGLGLVDHPTFLELARQGPFLGSAAILGYYRRHRDSQSLNYIVELTDGERRLAYESLRPDDAPRGRGFRRRMDRSWALECARALLTDGRLRLLRGQRRGARDSFRRCLSAERPARWLQPRLLAVKLAALAVFVLSFLPVNVERIAGRVRLRSSSLLERSERGL